MHKIITEHDRSRARRPVSRRTCCLACPGIQERHHARKAIREDVAASALLYELKDLRDRYVLACKHGIGEVDISAHMSCSGGVRASGKTDRNRADAHFAHLLYDRFAVRFVRIAGSRGLAPPQELRSRGLRG
jgi:hypothetical protein